LLAKSLLFLTDPSNQKPQITSKQFRSFGHMFELTVIYLAAAGLFMAVFSVVGVYMMRGEVSVSLIGVLAFIGYIIFRRYNRRLAERK
jgi:Flp pilus assembly protein TadB